MQKVDTFKMIINDSTLLGKIANQRTLLFMLICEEMGKDTIVNLSIYIKRKIATKLRSEAIDVIGIIDQLTSKLKKIGLLAKVDEGAFMVNPKIATKYIDGKFPIQTLQDKFDKYKDAEKKEA